MSIPVSYTEKTLAEYMHTMLGKTAKVLDLHFGPNDAGDYAEAVNDALLAYGTEDISAISGIINIKKLRSLALVCAWQYVVNNFVALYDFSADDATYDRSQLFANAQKALELVQAAALSYSPNYRGKIVAVEYRHNPYRYWPEDATSR